MAEAVQRGLVPEGFEGSKQAVRGTIRLRPDGEIDWQKLQGHVYGKGIAGACAFEGLDRFLNRARAAGAHVVIVSHKTEFGHYDPERVNLRTAALKWMEARGFFAIGGFGLDRSDVHFAATRAEKLVRIAELACDVFVDDLEEVLTDPEFPPGVRRILFSDHATRDPSYRVCRSWDCVGRAVFG